MHGVSQFQRALQLLEGPAGYRPSTEEITEGFGYVWAAIRFADHWSPALRGHAAGLIVTMRRYGSFHETAQQLTDHELRDWVELLRRFLADAEGLGEARYVTGGVYRPPGALRKA